MDQQAVKLAPDPLLRAQLLAIPEGSWLEACRHYWSMSSKRMPTKTLREDVRMRRHWVRTPNKKSVGRVAEMPLDLVKVAAEHLEQSGHVEEAGIPTDVDGWRYLLDAITEHICADYARFCQLVAPVELDWSPPEARKDADLPHTLNDAQPHDDGDVEAAGTDIVAVRTGAELRARFDEMRALGARVLGALDLTRSAVEDAQPIDQNLIQLCAAWDAELKLFAVSLYGRENYERGFGALSDAVDRLLDLEQARADDAQLRSDKLAKIDKFKEHREDGLYAEDSEYRDFVEARISELKREITEISELRGAEPDVRVPVADDGGSEASAPEDARRQDASESSGIGRVDIAHVRKSSDRAFFETHEDGELDALTETAAIDGAHDRAVPERHPELEPALPETEPEPEPEPELAEPVVDHRYAVTVVPAPTVLDNPIVAEPSDEALRESLAQLIDRNQWAALSVVAHVTALDAELVRALHFCAEAFSLPIAATDPSELLSRNAGHVAEGIQSASPATALANVVAVLRTCLQFGRDHSWLLTEQSFDRLPGGWRDVGRQLHGAIVTGYQHRWDEATTIHAATPPSEFKRRVADLRDTLPKRGNRLARAGNILRQLMLPGAELAVALDVVDQWADGTGSVETLRERRAELSDIRRIVDRTDTSLGGPKKRIEANAYEKLAARMGEVVELLDHAIVVAESATKRNAAPEPRSDEIRALLKNLPLVDVEDPLAAAVLGRFHDWLISGDERVTDVPRTFAELKFAGSLPASSAVRDERHNLPEASGVPVSVLLAELASPATGGALFKSYLRGGNLSAAAAVDSQGDKPLEYRTAQRDWRHRIEALAIELQANLLRLQAQTQVPPVERSAFDGRITALSQVDGDRFDIASREAKGIEDDLAQLWELGRVEVAASLRELDLDTGLLTGDKDRIQLLIDQHDFVTAREFMAMLSIDGTKELPRSSDDGLRALASFHDLLSGWPSTPTNAMSLVESRLGTSPSETISVALRAWNQAERVRKPAEWARLIPSILNLLGLQKIPDISIVDRTERHQKIGKFVVKALPIGGSYVAALGSRTRLKGYTIWAMPEGGSIEALFGEIPSAERRDANLILCTSVLGWDERQRIRAAADKNKVTALVIDTAVVVHMALQREQTFHGLQRVTLPFSTFAHWAPRVAGDVPDELFVGRVDLIDKIMSPEGSIFVYGGRQLGKSALLHRIERDFNLGQKKLAFYIDFKVERIGEENEPEHLWTVLRNRFQQAGIIPPANTSTKAEAIEKVVRDWLEADPERGILLLCDETDAFLQNEARERLVNNRATSFPNVTVLKGLMDATHRRFKPVFAGLHQVQRIAETPNSPLPHGGEHVLVGPLDPHEAWELVVRPFKALGFAFESVDLVWRLLAFTNYQAGLVQIVCDELYRHKREQPVAGSEPPYVIHASDVDHVITNKTVRDFIAERFRLTIQLEDRYFVIAMVVALLGLESGFVNQYSQGEILYYCRMFWRGGFELTEDALAVYLDEMVGLGVLIKGIEDTHYGMRSPNVVRLLGDRETIERQLNEGKFDLPLQYNPGVSRRRLSEARGVEIYSPLSEYDLSRVMPKRAVTRTNYTVAVVGSPALGIGTVRDLLSAASAEGYEYRLQLVSADEARELVNVATGVIVNRPLVVCDAVNRPDRFGEVISRLKAAQANKIGRRAVLLGPMGASARSELESAGVEFVPLRPWSTETVRATIDNPITDPTQRDQFIAATGGWPALCERYLNDIRTGAAPAVAEAIEGAERFPATVAEAGDFLADVGLTDTEELALLTEWASISEPGDVVDDETLTDLLDTSVDDLRAVIDRLGALAVISEHTKGYMLNDVVHRALLAVSTSDAG